MVESWHKINVPSEPAFIKFLNVLVCKFLLGRVAQTFKKLALGRKRHALAVYNLAGAEVPTRLVLCGNGGVSVDVLGVAYPRTTGVGKVQVCAKATLRHVNFKAVGFNVVNKFLHEWFHGLSFFG